MPGLTPQATTVVPQKPDFKDTLQLQGAGGKQTESTITSLKQWLDEAEASLREFQTKDKNTPELEMQALGRISRFGLRTPEDVRIFLDSPAGESVVEALIESELAEISALENAQFEAREHLLHRKLFIAFLILGLLYKRDAHAHQLIDHTLEALSKKLQGRDKAVTPEATTHVEHAAQDFRGYSAAEQVTEMLHNKIRESEELEKQLAKMEAQHQETQAKYATLHEHLDKAHQEFEKLIAEQGSTASAKDALAAKTTQLIENLTQQITADAESIAAALENGEEEKARALLLESNGRNLQVAALREMLSVAQGKSVMYDRELKPTTSFADAEYVLESAIIVEENGKYYLLRTHQTLEDMSTDERAQAEKQFKSLEPAETRSIRNLVHHHNRLENAQHDALSARSDEMQRDILLLAERLSTMQESSATAELSLRPTPTNAPALKMSPTSTAAPTPSPQARPASKVEQNLVESYEHVLRLMSNGPTPRAIKWLQDGFARTDTSSAFKRQLNDLKPGLPIPQATMNNLLAMKTVGQTLLGMRKPDVYKGLLSTAPSPFNMRPRGM